MRYILIALFSLLLAACQSDQSDSMEEAGEDAADAVEQTSEEAGEEAAEAYEEVQEKGAEAREEIEEFVEDGPEAGEEAMYEKVWARAEELAVEARMKTEKALEMAGRRR